MDVPQVLEYLGLSDQDWGPDVSSYAGLAAGWRGSVPVPSEQDMLAAWATIEAEREANRLLKLRAAAKAALDDAEERTYLLVRALALVTLDEINLLRGQHSLAPRTATQLRNAIKNKLDNGDADD